MKKILKENFKKITALLLAVSMAMSFDISAFAQEDITEDIFAQDESLIEDTLNDEAEVEISNEPIAEDSLEEELIEEDSLEQELIEDSFEEEGADGISDSSSDQEARERECMPNSPDYLKKFLTYMSIKYPQIGIDPKYGTGGNHDISDHTDELYNSYNAAKMKRQKVYDTIEIDGNDTFKDYPGLTDNMVQFRYLGCFGDIIGSDDKGQPIYSDTVKTLIIRNVDEIRNLYVPASIETLIIENTTLNCYYWENDSPGFQCGMIPGDLQYCRNLKKLIINNVKFGDNYKHPELEVGKWGSCGYEENFVLNLQNCHELEELVIDVSFDGARELQLTINGGTDNLFDNLTDEKCLINPAPGTGFGQVNLYADKNSYLANRYNSSETVDFKNKRFRMWLLEALGVDTNNDGVISQTEIEAIETLVLNDQTAHSAPQTSLSAFEELADISLFSKLKTLEIDFYDPTSKSDNGYRHSLKGIDFPKSLENLSMKNIYWEKDTQTKSHDDADIRLRNLRTLELYNTDVKVGSGDSYFNHSTQIELEDTEGVLHSVMINRTDVESITLTNNSNGAGIVDNDEKQRIRFSASDCQKLTSIEFLGEGYAVESSLDLSNDKKLTHIGIPNKSGTQWTVYGELESTYAPTNVILNSCVMLGSECEKIIIDYDFINGRSINVQAMDTRFGDSHELTIYRNPRIEKDTAGMVYLSCDEGSWVYDRYKDKEGFVIEEKTSFPTIAVFERGQRVRTSGEGQHSSESIYTKDTDCWVDRGDLVMPQGGYSSDFGNLAFYVVDEVPDSNNEGKYVDTLRKVFYTGDVYVKWDKQNEKDSIITLPTVKDEITGGYKLSGTKLSSTGIPGEVQLMLYVYNAGGDISYIGYQDIKVFAIPDSVELVNDGTKRGGGTKDDPFIIGKNEELRVKARPMVNGIVDRSGKHALRDVYWRIKEYDEIPKYTSDSDGYSLYTLDSATKAGISVVRGKLNDGETEAQYDRRIDDSGENGEDSPCYNHRRLTFGNAGSKFKIVAQSPYKNYERNKDGEVISSEVYVEISDEQVSVDISNDNKLIHGKNGWDETTITIHNTENTDNVDVSIKKQVLYEDCFIVVRDPSSTDSKEVWKLKINGSDNSKIKKIINNKKSLTLVIKADDKTFERVISLSSVFPDTETFWCSEIEDRTYTGKAIKPKLNIYNGKLRLVEGKDYTLSYGRNTNAVSKDATDKKGKRIGPSITIKGKGNYSDKQTYYFSIIPRSIESTAKIDDIIVKNTGKEIKISPTVTLDGKKLKQGSDYLVSATSGEEGAIESLKDPDEYTLYVVGKGNYTGAIPFRFTITESVPASKVSIQKIAKQKYNDGAEIRPDIKISYNKKDVTDCFDIEFENNIEIGTATVVVTSKKTSEGKDFIGEAGYGFYGIKKAFFQIDGLKISDTKLGINGKDKMPEFIYSGKRHKPTIALYYKTETEPLEEGKDYTITYSNNINARTASAFVKGKGKYTGTKELKFKIHKYDAEKDIDGIVKVNGDSPISVVYEKGGTTPKPSIAMNGSILTEKKDYTISYQNHKAVADKTAAKAPAMIIKFKGNFSGRKSVPFTISAKDIAAGTISIADTGVSTKANAWKQSAVTIVDTNGKKLAAGTDYSKTFEYYSDDACTAAITETTLPANTTVYVKVLGKGNYDGSSIIGSYRISDKNISAAAAEIADQTCTGDEICPTADEMLVTVGTNNNKTSLTAGVDYEVVAGSYTRNINKGTASVTIRGIGEYYGTKVVKYKIVVNRISWWNW